MPLKIAVIISGRHRPLKAETIAFTSFLAGMSSPTFNLPFWRLSARLSFPLRLRRMSRTGVRVASFRSMAVSQWLLSNQGIDRT
jgi:hypothetical protein